MEPFNNPESFFTCLLILTFSYSNVAKLSDETQWQHLLFRGFTSQKNISWITVNIFHRQQTKVLCSYPSTVLQSNARSETIPSCLASFEIKFLRQSAAVVTPSNVGTNSSWINSCNYNKNGKFFQYFTFLSGNTSF